jgi:asparagine synthetase B (glutamine-hydrolysing)
LKITQNIIPSHSVFYDSLEKKILKNPNSCSKEIDYKSICEFLAFGFFLDDSTYFKNIKTLKPSTEYNFEEGNIISEKQLFKWHYSPVERPLSQVVKEFSELFETIIKEQVENKKVILPLSGGLDSRTLAVALSHLGIETKAYSYEFTNGLNETTYGKKIAKICCFPFQSWQIPKSYLWQNIEELAQINQCYSEFTHPRQMAFVEKYKSLGNSFLLGHWGDVLFDDMGVSNDLPLEKQVDVILNKIVKKGGLELANTLWKNWKLEGDFLETIRDKIHYILKQIGIDNNANASIRAFKSLYWATRWTNVNLSVFESVAPIFLPYFDNRMCEFICTVPEKYLLGRQIQIEYIKLRNPKIAKITWQEKRPFNLYDYHLNKFPYNFPYRVINKLKRMFSSNKFIQRNWELQFLGEENDTELKNHLFENESFNELVPEEIISHFYNQFKTKDAVFYSHPVSMLLTLSMFAKQNSKK